ncbi:MAG: tetratricopeptide repeat protein [Thermoplasmatales archaeon]|nr:tetratricopeptide repeat protein [Thermoplasmatales archaeon]
MDREEKCKADRHNAWDKSKNVQDRIKRLEKVVSEYPEYMTALSDIAVSYLEIGDTEIAIKTYQKIINLKDTFESVWDNDLGIAYLFTNDIEKAIETLEEFNLHGYDYDNGLFIAFAYLKKGDRKRFEEQFDKWISEDLEKSFEQYEHREYINALFNKKETKFIEKIWNKYYKKYSNMDPYKLYCELYKQHYIRSKTDDEDDINIPAKLSRAEFEELKTEYLYLDRKAMFGDTDDAGYERWFELKDLLFADVIFG